MSPVEELYRSYLDLRWHFDPPAASAAGVSTQDDRLGTFDPESMRTHLAAFKAMAGAVELLDLEDIQEEIDRTAFLDEIRVTIFRFEHEQPHVRDPGFWVSHLFQGFHTLLKRHDHRLRDRARGILGRLQATPAFLRAGRETLKAPPRVLLETGLQMAEAGLPLLAQAALRARESAPELVDALDAASAEAEAALARFALALRSDFQSPADELSFAIGEEQFNRRLHHEHALQAGAPELYRYGLHLIEEVEAELTAIAKQIDPTVPWKTLVERLRADHPPADLVAAFRREMERTRDFVRDRKLVRIPPGVLEVVETPAFLRPLIPFAAYDPPEVYSADKIGLFYVTPPVGHAPSRPEASLHELAATALHEGYPGHHLQMLTAQGLQAEVRRNLWTPVTVEGWAVYCEEMMNQEGFFATLEERLFQRIHLLWRAARIVLDVGLHTRGLTPTQATDQLVDLLAMDRRKAEAEVNRYCATPTYQLAYAVGRREILQLRDAYRERAGSTFELRDFHQEFLSYGGLPVALIRWGMGLDE